MAFGIFSFALFSLFPPRSIQMTPTLESGQGYILKRHHALFRDGMIFLSIPCQESENW